MAVNEHQVKDSKAWKDLDRNPLAKEKFYRSSLVEELREKLEQENKESYIDICI